MRFFFTLSNFYQSTQNQQQTQEAFPSNGEFIDEHLFIEALALCAIDIPYKDE